MPERRVARYVAIAAVIVFAGVSARSLRLEYAPDVSFPEIAVTLFLPPSSNVDSTVTTRRWVVPIESALRAIGDTTGIRGDVGAGSARLVARFERGTDIDVKAARLASELAHVRAQLPQHAMLAVYPTHAGVRPSIELAIRGAAAPDIAQRAAEELRSTAGVRDVRTFGTRRNEIDVNLITDVASPPVPRTLIERSMPRPIGDIRSGRRRLDVFSAPAFTNIRDAIVPTPALTRLGAIAEIGQRREEPDSMAKLNGQPAVILSVFRDEDTSLLEFDRSVRRVVGRRGTVIWSDAAELRIILRRVLAGALIAALLLWLAGGWRTALFVPLAIAVAINAWGLTGARVDASTLLGVSIAVASVAPFAAARSSLRDRWPLLIGAAFVALLPLATIYGTGALAPLLTPAARNFAVAACCALAAAALIEPAAFPRAARVKSILRNSASVALACFTVMIALLSWFGDRLDPRRTEGSADRKRVYVRMRLPAGATLAQTSRATASIEAALRTIEGVDRFWTYAEPADATIVVEIARAIQDPQRFDLFRNELRARVPAAVGSVTIQNGFESASATALAESIEEQPTADESGGAYRFLLKGTDADALRAAFEALSATLVRGGVGRYAIRSEWPAASPRIELIPNRDIAPEIAAVLAGTLARRSLPAVEEEMPNGTVLRVVSRDAPRQRDDVPQRADLFTAVIDAGGQTFAPAAAFTIRDSSIEGRVTRELGRFVLPVNIGVAGYSLEQRMTKRSEIDRSIAQAQMPPGVFVERPALDSWTFSRAKLRLAAMAAILPMLILVAAVIVLGSFARALIAIIPAAIGVAFVAPALAVVLARLDELTLLGTGGAVCCVAALSVATLIRIGGPTVSRTYRTSRASTAPVIVAAFAGVALLATAASARPAIGDTWRAPLIAAAAVLAAGVPASILVPGAFDILLRDAARRRSPEARALARPAAWFGTDLPRLSVQSVTKRYASGFRALHRISFDLRPGVIGLLGPNGAGKTTLLRIMTGLLEPTRGVVKYQGVPLRSGNLAYFRRSIGFLPQEFNAYAGLTAVQFLDFWALERGIDDARVRREQIDELLAAVGLDEHANRRVREFSGGMRQRIGIARALLGDPPILVVDEPTTGLDIEARRRFRDLLIALARNRIIILSSHIASDVETTAMHLILLSRGELRWQGTVDALLARAQGRVFEAIVSESDVRDLAHRYRLTARVRITSGIRVRGVVPAGEPLPGSKAEPTLEEAYLSEVSTGVLRTGSFAFVFQRET